MTSKLAIVNQKKERFLSAPYFAVVGASTNPAKNGYKALKWLVEQHKDVTPVNLKASEIQGLKCVKALSELPDPTHTSVSIVVHPETTLEILQQAKTLGIFSLWLQPGAEDDAVVDFIQSDAQLDARCIYSTHALQHAPSRTRSKPDPLSTSTNLPKVANNMVSSDDTSDTPPQCLFTDATSLPKVANGMVPLDDTPEKTPPQCLFADEPTTEDASVKSIARTVIANKKNDTVFDQKKARFLSAPHFAVVGASNDTKKNGSKALKWLVDHQKGKDVVPINLKATEIQNLKCMKALSELPDPTHTSVSVVVPPKATLDIMQQAKNLGIFALWLQPGAEDDAVVQFIQADAQLDQRCIYSTHALHDSPLLVHALATGPGTDTNGQCLFAEPTAVATAPPPAAPAVASNVAAGIKRDMLSPPSTPPVTKSAKLADDSVHTMDLGEEIPGLA